MVSSDTADRVTRNTEFDTRLCFSGMEDLIFIQGRNNYCLLIYRAWFLCVLQRNSRSRAQRTSHPPEHEQRGEENVSYQIVYCSMVTEPERRGESNMYEYGSSCLQMMYTI